jgi:hypothetical protein
MGGFGLGGGCTGGGNGGGGVPLVESAFSEFMEATSVPAGAETTVLTHAVTLGSPILIVRIEFSGSNIARYRLYADANLEAESWTWFNGPMSGEWNFATPQLGGWKVQGGTVLRIKVLHNRPFVGDFSVRLHGIIAVANP